MLSECQKFELYADKTPGYGPNGDCWLWTGSVKQNGYGLNGKKLTHRLSFEIFNGSITNKDVILHSCDFKTCVNPKHLSKGTNFSNLQDYLLKTKQGTFHATSISLIKEKGKRRTIPVIERFKIFVNKTENECWSWSGHKTNGYGVISHKQKNVYIHRFSLEHHKHLCILPGYFACHICDNKECSNPDHLYIGTAADNCKDRFDRSQQARGSAHVNAKATEEIVKLIRKEYSFHKITRKILALKYGIPETTVRGIIENRTWRHVS